jgi:hypothetical protein
MRLIQAIMYFDEVGLVVRWGENMLPRRHKESQRLYQNKKTALHFFVTLSVLVPLWRAFFGH